MTAEEPHRNRKQTLQRQLEGKLEPGPSDHHGGHQERAVRLVREEKLTPNYDIRAAGNKNRQKFLCEVRVDSFSYIGMGNSSNKKDAQTNAARDFVNFLVRSGEMSAAEVPAPGVSATITR
ncbi:hypothetical protein F7725_010859, partial [Dissostichus mawsoni]